ncbi:MAG: hypothetical protein H7235_12415 [Bdellovibrionaceae bacterium]|nr:hypothetical protein [Pseudobdellovibrionaceae bacterium]
MIKTMTIFSILIGSVTAFADAPTVNVKALICQGTAEEPGQPRDILNLVQQPDGTFILSYANEAREKSPSLKTLSKAMNCDFSAENPKLFNCDILSQDASITSSTTTTKQFIPTLGISSSTSVSVIISGVGVAADVPQTVQVLKFMFESNCKVTQ